MSNVTHTRCQTNHVVMRWTVLQQFRPPSPMVFQCILRCAPGGWAQFAPMGLHQTLVEFLAVLPSSSNEHMMVAGVAAAFLLQAGAEFLSAK